MKKFLFCIFLVSLVFAASADHRPVEKSVEAEINVTGEDYRYYGEADKVAYVARIQRDRVNGTLVENNIYENSSLSRWVGMTGSDAATMKIADILEREFGQDAKKPGFSQTDNEVHEYTLELTYNSALNYSYSFQELESAMPDEVVTTVHFEGHTNQGVLPVELEKRSRSPTEQLAGDADEQLVQQSRDTEQEGSDSLFQVATGFVQSLLNLLEL